VRNHDEKTKSMQRSVLPSTARKQARKERRLIHKRQRARERDMLSAVRKAASAVDSDFEFDSDPDFHEGRRISDTHWMVLDRRSADKIGPLTRWAGATVDADPDLHDAPVHEQVAYFAAILPGDLIGKHAVQHIEWALKYRDTPWGDWYAEASQRMEARRDQVAADARRILAAGRHRALNAALRRHYRATAHDGAVKPTGRMLLGAHDVDAFSADITRCGCLTEVACSRWRKCGRTCEVVAKIAQQGF
jgi:hypothetical protein